MQHTITARVIAAVTLFEGYSAGFYCDYLGISRKQFGSVARRRLQRYVSSSLCETYYLQDSQKYPQA